MEVLPEDGRDIIRDGICRIDDGRQDDWTVEAAADAEDAKEAAEDAQVGAETAQAAAELAQAKAEDALTKAPRIGSNGNWYYWDTLLGQWVDTGVKAKGETGPRGIQGEQGIQGVPGIQGIQGVPGKDGINGVVIQVMASEYGFSVNSSGHLILTYEDGSTPPDFYINEYGHLCYDY